MTQPPLFSSQAWGQEGDGLGTVVSLSGNNYEEGCLEVWFDRAERFEPTPKVDLEAIAWG